MSSKDCPDCRRVGCPTWTEARKCPSYTGALNDCIDAQDRLRAAALVIGVAALDMVVGLGWADGQWPWRNMRFHMERSGLDAALREDAK